uniref:Filament-like plant protein 4 n=1 Tax=Kalanchoe fedtschenkoi TaxID=63787 RepID=A0A7N0R842_KALFE
MDRRWPWKKKSSDKAALERAATAAALESATASLVSVGTIPNQENYKKPNYVQISVESYTHFTGLENQVKTYQEQLQTLENQVKTYEEQFQTLENQIEELNEKLSQAWSEVETKENRVKQHAKVAEDAVVGWEKAETEVVALQSHVDSLKLSKRAAEDRAAHLDGALKEYMQQIRNMKDEHAQELRDVIYSKTKQWDKIKHELETKIANLEQQFLLSEAENAALSRSLQERGNLIFQINEEKSQAEAEIEFLKGKIESCEREINSLKYELHVASKELEIRSEEKNMSVKSADVANKQYLDGIKKITKLEAECQRLRGLVRKKLPGPAALAQMRSEVETLGRDCGESRTRKSSSKPSSPYSPLPEFNFDNSQKLQKDNEFLTDRLLAMEEETKMLKEALAKCNIELQVSRNVCGKTASKLHGIEAQQPHNFKKDPLKTKPASTTRSLVSMSDDGIDDSVSCAEPWTTASNSELSYSKREKFARQKTTDVNQLELMDDFLEMEKLAHTSSESNGSITHLDKLDLKSNHVVKTDAESDSEQSPLWKLRTRILTVFESQSIESDLVETVESLKSILENINPTHSTDNEQCCPDMEVKCSDSTGNEQCCPGTDGMTILDKFSFQNSSRVLHLSSEDLAVAISQIRDFVLSLGNEIRAVRASSGDISGLIEKFEKFSISFDDSLHGNQSLAEFVMELAHILRAANKFSFSILACSANDGETHISDCVDKVALPVNKVTHSDTMRESYPNGGSDVPDSPYPELPPNRNSTPGVELSTACSSPNELKELMLEKEGLAENLEHMKSQLFEAEQLLAELKSQLAAAERSNSMAETQLKCMTEAYRSLEKHAKELETEVDHLREKSKALELEIQEEKKKNQNTMETCNYLQERLERNRDILASSDYETDYKMQQEIELAAAAEKLAKCQETISQLGKQFESLRPQAEVLGSPQSEGSEAIDRLDITEKGTVASLLQRSESHSSTTDLYVDLSSRLNSEATTLPKSPASSSKLPRHRYTMSGSSVSSSTPTPEKHTRASFGRIFTSKRSV